ncbi:restriction endonuclease [Streptomyces atroolivaceus]|uniref:restriction endonuclease n=1 Tax=Streptomyces atroolivaceus TaxID=66869 RepID=UPI00202575A1|nr:restriction endonuclease [Streptomyces atroolivaceus]
MGIQMRRGVREGHRSEFDVRRTALGFVLLALLVCGAGLAARTVLESAGRHPVIAVASVVVLVAGAVALLRRRRSRRAAARAAAAAVETAYEVVDAALEEASAAEAAPVAVPVAVPEQARPVDYAAMDPYDFEEAVAGLCRRDGCPDVEVVGGAGDLGADVLATTPDGRRLVVQCKRYTSDNKVGSQDLQRFGGTCYAVHEAEVAVVVTTGEFTEPALDYAEQCGIVCVGLDELTAWSEGAAAPPWYAGAAVQPAEG